MSKPHDNRLRRPAPAAAGPRTRAGPATGGPTAGGSGAGKTAGGAGPRIFPPAGPVEVPRRPAPVPPETGEAGRMPPHDTAADSSWADNTEPAPYKTNVRNSNYP